MLKIYWNENRKICQNLFVIFLGFDKSYSIKLNCVKSQNIDISKKKYLAYIDLKFHSLNTGSLETSVTVPW